jgi:hypothetical protein
VLDTLLAAWRSMRPRYQGAGENFVEKVHRLTTLGFLIEVEPCRRAQRHCSGRPNRLYNPRETLLLAFDAIIGRDGHPLREFGAKVHRTATSASQSRSSRRQRACGRDQRVLLGAPWTVERARHSSGCLAIDARPFEVAQEQGGRKERPGVGVFSSLPVAAGGTVFSHAACCYPRRLAHAQPTARTTT